MLGQSRDGSVHLWSTLGLRATVSSGIKYDGVGGPHANIDLELKLTATVTVLLEDVINLFLPKLFSARTRAFVAMLSHIRTWSSFPYKPPH